MVPMLSPVSTPGRFDTPPCHVFASPPKGKRKREASESPTRSTPRNIPKFKKRRTDRDAALPVSQDLDSQSIPDATATKYAPSHLRDAMFEDNLSTIFDFLPFEELVSALVVDRKWHDLLLNKLFQDHRLILPAQAVDPDAHGSLSRSTGPLSLFMHVRAKTSLAAWLSRYLSRVETLDIAAMLRLPRAENLCLTSAVYMKSLVTLSLSVPKAHDYPFTVPTGLFPGGAPNLQQVRLRNVHLPSDDGPVAAFQNVQSLEYTLGETVSTIYLSDVFRHFPYLRCLSLSIHGHSGPARVTSTSPLLSHVSLLRPLTSLVSLFFDPSAFPGLAEVCIPECTPDLLDALPDGVHSLLLQLQSTQDSPRAEATLDFSTGLRIKIARLKDAVPLHLGARLLASLHRLSLPAALVPDIRFAAPDSGLAYSCEPLDLCVDGEADVNALVASLKRSVPARGVVLRRETTTDAAC